MILLSKKRWINLGIAGYQWSDVINIDVLNLHYFMLRNQQQDVSETAHGFTVEAFITMCLEISVVQDSHLLTIRRETDKGSFKFINNLDDMIVFLSQDPSHLERNVAEVMMHPMTWAYYSWPSTHSKKRDLYMRVLNLKTDNLSSIARVEYEVQAMSYDILKTRIYHKAEMSGASLEFTFSSILEEIDNSRLIKQIELNIPYLGLSIIGGNRENRRELLYISMSELIIKANYFEKFTKIYMRLRYFNIDNNSEFVSHYPIFLSPEYSFEMMRKFDKQHVDLYVKMLNKPKDGQLENITVINKVNLNLIGSVLKIEESFIHFALNAMEGAIQENKMSQAFMLKKQVRELEIDPDEQKDYKIDLRDGSEKNYRGIDMQKLQPTTMYINELEISEHTMEISLKRERGDDSKAALNKYSKYLKSYGFDYMVSIEGLMLHFNKFELENDIYPAQTVQTEVVRQYRNNAVRSALSSMLDLNILGNPSKVARELKLGMKDMVDLPSKRAHENNNSMIGLSKGIGEGSKSMVKHTAIGTLGAMSTITRTVGNLSSDLTFDKRYMKERNKLRSTQANKDMGTMNQSLRQLGFSMKESVSGLFTKPAEMSEKEDIWGAIKGSFIGVGGLITKPITGIFDFASTLTKGARDNIDTDNIAPSNDRVRNPRAFYGKTSLIK